MDAKAPLAQDARSFSWLNRSVLGIGLASLLADAGHEMATAALPALLASLGAGSAALGLIEGFSDALAGFAKLFSGFYSDGLRRRKPLAVAGYALTAACMGGLAWAQSAGQAFFLRSTGWLGRGARGPARKAILSETAPSGAVGRAFGFERAMDNLGAVLGPLLALCFIARLGLRPALAFTFVPGILAAAVFWFWVKEPPRARPVPRGLPEGWRALPRRFKRLLAASAAAGAGDFSKTLLILWAEEAWRGRLGFARAAFWAMLFYAGYNAVQVVSSYACGHLADKFSGTRILSLGYAAAVAPAALLLLPGSAPLKFAAAFGLFGLCSGAWETLESAAAAGLLPENLRGAGFGALAAVNGAGDFVSSAAVGLLWAVSPAAAMGYAMAGAGAGALLAARI
ncbi:MAG TPA: MFS transporter [Elusimicrobiota bacterium]|nr:MFS transporter [Elusimicrobiota bacterium]